MQRQKKKGLTLVIATTLLLGLSGTSALAMIAPNPNNLILNGTYQAIGQRVGLYTGAGWVNAQISGDKGTVTFNGDGTCSGSVGGNAYSLPLGIMDPTVDIYPNPATPFDCTYDVADDGSVSLTHPDNGGTSTETFYTNPDGSLILKGGAEQSANDLGGTDYDTEQFTMVKVVDSPTLKGTFHAVNQDAGFWGSSAGLYGGGGTLTFSGTGGCTYTFANGSYNLGPDGTVTDSPDGGSGKCTYTTGADGEVTVTVSPTETEVFFLSSDGNVILQGGSQETTGDGGGTGYETRQMVAVKLGSTLTKASLQGTFRMISQDASFWSSAPAGGASINLWGDNGILTFNGAGVCSYEFEGLNLNVPAGVQNPTVMATPEVSSGSCTYTVAANGAVTLTHADGTEKFWLSANGATLIGGYAKMTPEPNGAEYRVTQTVAIKTNQYVGLNPTPSRLDVPLVDPDGNYLIEWNEVDLGLTYVLQESKDPTFTTGVRTAYKGTKLSTNITLRPKGQSYYYRVRTEKTGYEPSEWYPALNPCNVGTPLLPATLTVPAKAADGTYTIRWAASKTPDVTYIVEEATDSAFLTPKEIYGGFDTSYVVGNTIANTSGTTYYYRIKVQKKGFNPAESAWKKALNPCKVGVLAPRTLTVPVDPSINYNVSWDPSVTDGVTKYTLQEATNANFTLGLRTLTIADTIAPISGRKVGKTYYYRVRAIKPNYPASPWADTESCTVITPPVK